MAAFPRSEGDDHPGAQPRGQRARGGVRRRSPRPTIPAAGAVRRRLQVTQGRRVLRSGPSLNGTQMNCSGGPMPWGSWVTCEETVNGPDVGNDFSGGDNTKLRESTATSSRSRSTRAASARLHQVAVQVRARVGGLRPAERGHLPDRATTSRSRRASTGTCRRATRSKAAGSTTAGGCRCWRSGGAPNKDLSAGQPAGASVPT
ncbi:alkaline phosphatase PhoX [Nonomuraea dietziae]|uniref:alkaline phosphatase PhoX n=1 Tax=Nonomuraea dietziae TaxID=65515 RepID=UPI003CD0734A